MDLGIVRFDRQCLVIACGRFFQPAEALEYGTAVVEGAGVVRIDRNRPLDEFQRLGIISPLQLDNAQEMQGIELIGARRENEAIEALGLGKAPRRMMGGRQAENLRKGQLLVAHIKGLVQGFRG